MTRYLGPMVAFGLVLGAGLGNAQRALHPELREFLPIGELTLRVDGVDDAKASVLHSRRAVAFLVVSDQFASAFLLSPRTGSVGVVRSEDLHRNENLSIDLFADLSSQRVGKFRMENAEVVFDFEGKELRLVEKPPLLGWRIPAELTAYSPTYALRRDAFSPNPAALQFLEAWEEPLVVEVYFGSWCPFCQNVVPRMLKVHSMLGEGAIRIRYYGLPEVIREDAKAVALGISSVPVGVVQRSGREIGRITADAWADPALALKTILEAAAGK